MNFTQDIRIFKYWMVVSLNQGERLLLIDLLKVLHKHTDENHRIKQNEIINILEKEYGYENLYSRRKTVKNNMEKILEYSKCSDANEVLYKQRDRKVKDKKTGKEKRYKEFSDFGYVHDFTHAELRLVIDSILFSKQIPSNQRESLIEKLESLSSKHFDSRMDHLRTL